MINLNIAILILAIYGVARLIKGASWKEVIILDMIISFGVIIQIVKIVNSF